MVFIFAMSAVFSYISKNKNHPYSSPPPLNPYMGPGRSPGRAAGDPAVKIKAW
jgi:hypothetical protein